MNLRNTVRISEDYTYNVTYCHSFIHSAVIQCLLGRNQLGTNDRLLVTPHLLSWPRLASGIVNALEDHSSGRLTGPAISLGSRRRSSSSLRPAWCGEKMLWGAGDRSQCLLLPLYLLQCRVTMAGDPYLLDPRNNSPKKTRTAARVQLPVLCLTGQPQLAHLL